DMSEVGEVQNSGFECHGPFYLLTVKHDGKIFPCCSAMYENEACFNIENISIADYWRHPDSIKFAEMIDKKVYIDCCKRCMSCVRF
ncbi:MAG: SPASM domain-containing protein, partial [Oscillospiraceae bacterium]|nr:SPASM domain-containing protein [Oscillospiraceae bacterium]